MGIPTPDWSTWIHRPKVECWEAIALARDVDPYAVEYWREGKNHYWFGEARRGSSWDSTSTGRAKEQRVWIDTLVSVASDEKTRPFVIGSYVVDERTEISLSQFAAWAVNKMRWKVPAPLAALAGDAPPTAKSGKWPWGDYENKNLQLLEKAVARFWAEWKDGQSEHINKTVQAYLEELGMDSEPASQVASLIRPDPLKKGGRPKSGDR